MIATLAAHDKTGFDDMGKDQYALCLPAECTRSRRLLIERLERGGDVLIQ